MAKDSAKSWQFNRQINISVLVQLLFLASLIVGSWVNLQRQLDFLQRDVSMLLQCQKNFAAKLETLSAKSISYEYRLRAIEKQLPKADIELSKSRSMSQSQ
jgi:Tfp pilus assembly protein PilO